MKTNNENGSSEKECSTGAKPVLSSRLFLFEGIKNYALNIATEDLRYIKLCQKIDEVYEIAKTNNDSFYDNQSIQFMCWCEENKGWIARYSNKQKLEMFKKENKERYE